MSRSIRLLLATTFALVLQQSYTEAAIEEPDGTVSLLWTASYTPFSWKFSVDPFPIRNGSLSILYDPERAAYRGVADTNDYRIVSEGFDRVGEVANIRFAAGPTGPPSGDMALVFDAFFDDLVPDLTQQGMVPEFTVFAGMEGQTRWLDGFNFPVDEQGNILWDQPPEITPDMITPFTDHAPVPEPHAGLLFMLGTLGLALFRRRRS